MTDAEEHRDILATQLAMNRQTWSAMQSAGATEVTDLRLEFFYFAPGEQQARALAALLARETDYDVRLDSDGGLLKGKKNWTVSGTTQATKVSPDVLDQWVTWMVAAGIQETCRFDGWGTLVPDT